MKKLLLFLFSFITIAIFAQKEANVWYFGFGAGLDFSSGTPVALTDGQLSTFEGCSTISDKNGKLLFYSDGITVWNKKHQVMKYSNGLSADDLKGNPSSTQSGLIVPHPTKPNIYFLFTVGTSRSSLWNPGFHYYTIDMTKNHGLGEVIGSPVDLAGSLAFRWSEKVTAVQGNKCDTIWVLSVVDNMFKAYKVDSDGVHSTPISSSINYTLIDRRGYLKASPDGKKVALADYSYPDSLNGKLVLFDFNDSTGKIARNGIELTNPLVDGTSYGVEFSQKSTKLYISTYRRGGDNSVFQFDLKAPDIASTKTLIHIQKGYRGALQLAPDGKIYASIPNRTFLNVIENPDADGKDIIYKENAVSLNGRVTTQGLPPFIQSFFAPVNIVNKATNKILNGKKQTFCIGDSYTIKAETTPIGATYIWTKDGKTIGTSSEITINGTDPTLGSGIYKLKIITPTCKTLESFVDINFVSKPAITNLIYEQCDTDKAPSDGFFIFDLKSKENELTNNASDVKVEFFENRHNLDTDKPIVNIQNYTNTQKVNQKLFVKVTNTITKCFEIGEIILKVNPTGLDTYPDVSISELDANASNPQAIKSEGSGNGTFDFSLKINDIINRSSGALSLKTHSFEFYGTKQDASLQKNQFNKNHLFVGSSDVYVRISTKGKNSCESIGKFTLSVKPLPSPQGSETTFLCVNNPIDTPQLLSVDLDADTGTIGDTYKWFLNGKELIGEDKAIYKATQKGIYKVVATRNYPNSKEQSIGYNTFVVKLSNKALIRETNLIDDVDNSKRNQLKIKVSGIGNYEYAIDNTLNFSSGDDNLSYTFPKVEPGIHVISVRDKNGCGVVKSKEIAPIHFQRFFTPNNDGHFDTWKILGINNSYYTAVAIQIFDRYGKIIHIINEKNGSWDGTHKGKPVLPQGYWFKAKITDKNGNIKRKTGHFSLIRN